jgi:hypothetical protein
MSSFLGHAPVLDFDGTIVRLPVDWSHLRRRLGVLRINDLWTLGRPDAFSLVTDMEVEAADVGEPVDVVMHELAWATSFAVLTNNSALAVRKFFSRFPDFERRLVCVIGRDELGGPKTEIEYFTPGLRQCLDATKTARADGPAIYVGDSAYELVFARRAGMTAFDVADLSSGRADGACGDTYGGTTVRW